MKRLLLLMAVAMLLSAAAPTFATNWGHNNWNNDWNNDWDHDWDNDWWNHDDEPKQEEKECDWDDWFDDWGAKLWACNGDLGQLADSNWWENKRDWPSQDEVDDWFGDHEWKSNRRGGGKWHCKHEDPIPEPATAGLAFMGMGALIAATRRRRK